MSDDEKILNAISFLRAFQGAHEAEAVAIEEMLTETRDHVASVDEENFNLRRQLDKANENIHALAHQAKTNLDAKDVKIEQLRAEVQALRGYLIIKGNEIAHIGEHGYLPDQGEDRTVVGKPQRIA